MDIITVIFFALGTWFGIENNRIAATETVVTIDFETREMIVKQYDLFTVIRNAEDSLEVARQLRLVYPEDTASVNPNWIGETDNYGRRSIEFTSHPKKNTLDLVLKFKYDKPEDLKIYGIDHRPGESTYSIRDFPDDHLTTSDGELRDGFWYFNGKATFTIKPDFPSAEAISGERRSLVNWWEEIKP